MKRGRLLKPPSHGGKPARFWIIGSRGDGLRLLDFQAIYERVIYEQALKSLPLLEEDELSSFSEKERKLIKKRGNYPELKEKELVEIASLASKNIGILSDIPKAKRFKKLFFQLLQIKDYYLCPHGLPTIINLAFSRPLKITSQIVVKLQGQDYLPQFPEKVIVLNNGLSFGSGSHPTTREILKALEKHLKPGDKVADIGTGSGILAIAAAKLGAKSVLALDIDELAVIEAPRNVSLNRVSKQIRVIRGSSEKLTNGYDLIVANLWGYQDIMEIIPQVSSHLKPTGIFISYLGEEEDISPTEGEKEAIQVLKGRGLKVIEIIEESKFLLLISTPSN